MFHFCLKIVNVSMKSGPDCHLNDLMLDLENLDDVVENPSNGEVQNFDTSSGDEEKMKPLRQALIIKKSEYLEKNSKNVGDER